MPVTAADRACEKLIVETILREFPEDGILGEEGSSRESRNGRKWIIDPIDGTRDFVRGLPLWAVLIGLERDGVMAAVGGALPQAGPAVMCRPARRMGERSAHSRCGQLAAGASGALL